MEPNDRSDAALREMQGSSLDEKIAMSKARMSLNLAQNVIDRITTSWNEITTTR